MTEDSSSFGFTTPGFVFTILRHENSCKIFSQICAKFHTEYYTGFQTVLRTDRLDFRHNSIDGVDVFRVVDLPFVPKKAGIDR